MHARDEGLMDMLLNDLRYALRTLRKSPGFTAASVATLALGIGATTAIFSVVDGVLLRPAPFDEMDRLAMVWETDRNSGTTREPASVPDYLDFRDRSERFESLAAVWPAEVNVTPADGAPRRIARLRITAGFLDMLGIEPLLGRAFTEEEDRPGGPAVALISEEIWERLFSRDPGAIGRTIRMDDVPYTIVGVLPSTADFGTIQLLSAAAYQRSFAEAGVRTSVDAWVPLQPDPEASRHGHPIFMLGRLAPGASPDAAQQEMSAIAADLEATHRESNEGRGAFVEPFREVVFGPVRPALLVLLSAVALVLLVACVNVANLLLARGAARVHDVAVRTALGADAGRLGRQFLTESVLLTLTAAAVGVLLAFSGLELLLALAPADIPRLGTVGIDGRVLGATLGISVLVGLAFGMVPTLQARRLDLQSALRGEHGRGASAGIRRRRLRSALVVAELALAVMLVSGAGLLLRSFWELQQVETGFRAEGVLKAEFDLPPSRYPVDFSRYPDLREMHAFNAALLERAAALPGVESAAIARSHPLAAGFTNSFVIVGREAETAGLPEISTRLVSPGYFETVGLPLFRGRLLRDADGTLQDPVLLVNESAASAFFPGADPLGQQISFWGANRTIVGVVADERFHGLDAPAAPAVYVPIAQAPPADGSEALLVRTEADPASLAGPVRAAIHGIDPALAVHGVEPLTETVSRSVGERRFTMLLLGVFAAVAVIMAVIGVHGVLGYMVAQRTPEIAIRAALGATGGNALRLIVGEGARLALVGLALGIVGALAASRLIRSLLFGVTTTDPLTFAAVAAIAFAAALVASYVPARRAMRVDPIVALRAE